MMHLTNTRSGLKLRSERDLQSTLSTKVKVRNLPYGTCDQRPFSCRVNQQALQPGPAVHAAKTGWFWREDRGRKVLPVGLPARSQSLRGSIWPAPKI